MVKQRLPYPSFEAAITRMKEITGQRTQSALARAIGIKQPTVSDATRRGVIPGDWLISLLEKYHANPLWITTGTGPRYLTGVSSMTKPELLIEDWRTTNPTEKGWYWFTPMPSTFPSITYFPAESSRFLSGYWLGPLRAPMPPCATLALEEHIRENSHNPE